MLFVKGCTEAKKIKNRQKAELTGKKEVAKKIGPEIVIRHVRQVNFERYYSLNPN